ncbi:hypothetical protein [Piscinibacter sakaiensis]|uniref:hypothetical protein n=1 Tax=Piscinibacter sakaiensis TaxID=1547922 RepID=UPI003AAD3584
MNVPSAANAASIPGQPQSDLDQASNAGLELSLSAVETRLAALGEALLQRDLPAIERESAELQRSLASAIDDFSRAARNAPIPPALRRRLANTGGHVAAQRESFARATAALDRAIDVLLPREVPAIYRPNGGHSRARIGAVLEA